MTRGLKIVFSLFRLAINEPRVPDWIFEALPLLIGRRPTTSDDNPRRGPFVPTMQNGKYRPRARSKETIELRKSMKSQLVHVRKSGHWVLKAKMSANDPERTAGA
jgi:hypothetical protein